MNVLNTDQCLIPKVFVPSPGTRCLASSWRFEAFYIEINGNHQLKSMDIPPFTLDQLAGSVLFELWGGSVLETFSQLLARP